MVAVIVVKWPKASLIRDTATLAAEHVTIKTVNRLHRANQAQTLELDEHPGLVQETCLLIACHKSCVTAERTHTFANTLRAALKVRGCDGLATTSRMMWVCVYQYVVRSPTQLNRVAVTLLDRHPGVSTEGDIRVR